MEPSALIKMNRDAAPLEQAPIRCVFLVHAIESWDALMGVYDAMRADRRFQPIALSINRNFPGDSGYGGEDVTSGELDKLGVPHLRLGIRDGAMALSALKQFAPDVIFRQSQWENDVPPAFRTTQLGFSRICSVPYGMSIVSKFWNTENNSSEISEESYNQIYHRSAWRVFCETELTRSFFLKHHKENQSKFVLSGYPKLTRLLNSRNQPASWPIQNNESNYRVIWAPHYSLDKNHLGFGVFDRIHEAFLAWAEASPHIEFVFKPHPALFSLAVTKKIMSVAAVEDFINRWNSLPNCAIESSGYAHLFAASDLMITDGLSFLTEYPAFEKPLIFFDSGHHVPMNPIGQIALDCAHIVRTFDEMRAAAEAYSRGAAFEAVDQRRKLLDLLFPTEKPPTEIILHAIAEGVYEERKAGSATV